MPEVTLAPVDSTTDLLGRPLRFSQRVVLSKDEAFRACQALADAGRVLVRSGGASEADTLGSLFSVLEERLVAR